MFRRNDWHAARTRALGGLVVSAAFCVAAEPGSSARLGVARCTTPQLVVWLNARGSGAAGSVYYHLEFTNLSGHTCTLRGFPGVSAVTLVGGQIGAPASRRVSTVRQVLLAQGKAASALLRVVDTANYPASRCRPALAAGLRVFPPGNRVSKVVPFAFHTCRAGAPVLSVNAVEGGRG